MPSKTTNLPLDSFDAFRALTTAAQAKLVGQIAKDREGGLSGNDLRERYGNWLTGPRRCKLAREFGHGAIVAPSYVEYNDDKDAVKVTGGAQRVGTRHAKLHGQGAAAVSRRAQVVAEREAAKLEAAAARMAKRAKAAK